MRLGEIRREKLDCAVEAAHAFEGVLDILDPAHMPALVALTDLYTRLSREPELLRILEATAAATVDKTARADVWQRVGELRDRRNEVDQAIAALRNAFELSPSNRALFTALERLCYKRERWLDADGTLIDAAIALVETRAARAIASVTVRAPRPGSSCSTSASPARPPPATCASSSSTPTTTPR